MMNHQSNQKATRSKGCVQYWNEKKGYGLIENEDGRDIIIYKTDMDFLTLLDVGDEVEYEIKDTKQGLKAIHVKILKDSLFINNR